MRLKWGRLLLLLCLLCIHHAAAQAQAGSSGIVDTIADSSQDFGDALSDAVSTAGKTVKSVASKAGGTVANATSTAAESIANKTTAAVAASASKLKPCVQLDQSLCSDRPVHYLIIHVWLPDILRHKHAPVWMVCDLWLPMQCWSLH